MSTLLSILLPLRGRLRLHPLQCRSRGAGQSRIRASSRACFCRQLY